MRTSMSSGRHHRLPVRELRCIAALAVASLFPMSTLAQSVGTVRVSKDKAYVQSMAGGVAPWTARSPCNFGCPLRFAAYVIGGNVGLLPAPVLSGPVNTGAIGAAWNGGRMSLAGPFEWRIGNGNWDYSPTQAGLDAVFPSGTYTITVGGKDIPVTLSGDAYPNAPVLAPTGGAWVDGAYVVNPSQRLTISTNDFDAYGANREGTIVLYVGSGGANVAGIAQSHSSLPGTNRATLDVLPGTLVDGREYYATASFAALVDINTTALPGADSAAEYRAITNMRIRADASFTGGTAAPPPVFPMTVTSNITPASASASAAIQYRPQDVGTSGSVYVFAVAPADLVRPAPSGSAFAIGKAVAAGGAKADPVACVLAQLNASGQLQAVSTASLQAYVTGVLSAQGQAVTILNGVPTVNIGGATFYVGYGASSTAMINNGINRSALTVPGTRVCKPQPPQTGWWWNPAEAGRGYSIEASGNSLFMAAYLYDVSGRATWHVATGPTSLDGSVFNGQLLSFGGGVTLSGPYRANSRLADAGPITLTFDDAAHGTLVWPGGTVAIERFAFGPGGPATPAMAGQPENGWWWGGGADSGRGFFIEWQGARAFLAGYMYDADGSAIWYVADSPVAEAQKVTGTWLQFANGQPLTGAYKPATVVNGSVAPVTIQFQGADTAILGLPSGSLPISRFRF